MTSATDTHGSRAAELYDAWLFAETDATLALAAWWSAPSALKCDAYAAYCAALEREAHAAGLLEQRLAPAAASPLTRAVAPVAPA